MRFGSQIQDPQRLAVTSKSWLGYLRLGYLHILSCNPWYLYSRKTEWHVLHPVNSAHLCSLHSLVAEYCPPPFLKSNFLCARAAITTWQSHNFSISNPKLTWNAIFFLFSFPSETSSKNATTWASFPFLISRALPRHRKLFFQNKKRRVLFLASSRWQRVLEFIVGTLSRRKIAIMRDFADVPSQYFASEFNFSRHAALRRGNVCFFRMSYALRLSMHDPFFLPFLSFFFSLSSSLLWKRLSKQVVREQKKKLKQIYSLLFLSLPFFSRSIWIILFSSPDLKVRLKY